MFGTLQGRLPQEVGAGGGSRRMEEAHEFLKTLWPRFNEAFATAPKEPKSAFSRLPAGAEDEVARDLLSQRLRGRSTTPTA